MRANLTLVIVLVSTTALGQSENWLGGSGTEKRGVRIREATGVFATSSSEEESNLDAQSYAEQTPSKTQLPTTMSGSTTEPSKILAQESRKTADKDQDTHSN